MLGHHRFAPNSVPYQNSKSWTPLPKHHASPCADPGIFVKGGGSRSSDKKSSDNLFFFCPQQILQTTNGQFQRNLSFFKVPEGVQHFPGGGGSNFFQGGSNCLFPIETHITCDFPGGPDLLSPPLDPHCQPEEIFYFKVSQWVHSSDSGLLLTM